MHAIFSFVKCDTDGVLQRKMMIKMVTSGQSFSPKKVAQAGGDLG